MVGVLVGATVACVIVARRVRFRDGLLAGLVVSDVEVVSRSRGASERLTNYVIAAAGCGIGFLAFGLPGVAIGFVAWMGSRRVLKRRREAKRRVALEQQMGDAVRSIAAALRAGLSLSQSIGYAGVECPLPLGGTLRMLADRQSMGETLDTALLRWADEVGGDDALLVTGVLRMHRRTGGDLPSVLDRVAATLRERGAMAGEVRALTAQARLSGAILGALPIGFFIFMALTSKQDISAAFHTSTGIAAVSLGLLMQAVAFLWIRRLLRVT